MLEQSTKTHENQSSADFYKIAEEKENGFVSPFIYFFEYGVKAGMFKDLGEINKLKEENPLYSSFIDQWMADAIKNNVVQIKTDGLIELKNRTKKDYTVKKPSNLKTLSPINDILHSQAIEQHEADPNSLSTFNFYSVDDEPELVEEYKQIVGEFYSKITKLSEKVSKKPVDKLHYVSISTCLINKEVFNEI